MSKDQKLPLYVRHIFYLFHRVHANVLGLVSGSQRMARTINPLNPSPYSDVLHFPSQSTASCIRHEDGDGCVKWRFCERVSFFWRSARAVLMRDTCPTSSVADIFGSLSLRIAENPQKRF